MSDYGFQSDAAYFDLVARQSKDPADQDQLRRVADIYREMAKNGVPGRSPLFAKSRAELWRDRAEECRTLSDQFKNEACRIQLNRLAEAYEKMAAFAKPPQE
jgi:hypothetical protein